MLEHRLFGYKFGNYISCFKIASWLVFVVIDIVFIFNVKAQMIWVNYSIANSLQNASST